MAATRDSDLRGGRKEGGKEGKKGEEDERMMLFRDSNVEKNPSRTENFASVTPVPPADKMF